MKEREGRKGGDINSLIVFFYIEFLHIEFSHYFFQHEMENSRVASVNKKCVDGRTQTSPKLSGPPCHKEFLIHLRQVAHNMSNCLKKSE